MSKTLDDIHDGSVAEEKAPITNDLREVAEHIKWMCYFLGVDMVGICEIPVYARSSHDLDGNRIDEFSRIGEKVLNPFLGLRFETSIITTDLSRTRFPWTQNWLNRSVQGGPEHDRQF